MRFLTQAAKGVGFFTAFTAVTYWAAEQDVKRGKELEKANPDCDVVSEIVPSAVGGSRVAFKLVPKKSENPQSTMTMRK